MLLRSIKYMRTITNINRDWTFEDPKTKELFQIDLPHTWNNEDGQDGGGDYYRGQAVYQHKFSCPDLSDDEVLYVEFKGVNSSAEVYLNGTLVGKHDGGYSTFRCDLTSAFKRGEENILKVLVDNSVNDHVYPQKADFTFYGGIYRDVNLIRTSKEHFDLDFFGAKGIKVDTKVNGEDAIITVTAYTKSEKKIAISILDDKGETILEGENGKELTISKVHLWNGLKDPYLYKAVAKLLSDDGTVLDEVSTNFGVRTFSIDPKKGFFLNGKSYPLHGVSRHQDRLHKGNALSKEDHDEDMDMIREIGANTIRLAHYQHDDYFYDLCDKYGMIVWAEIPYISQHLIHGDENAISQMQELVYQQYNHPSIVVWGVSNEITMVPKHKKEMLALNRKLNYLIHKMDPSRLTTLACYAVATPFNKTAHITDVVSWNLYLGWYVPFFFLNGLWISFFHLIYPHRCLGYSEYGAEGMPNLHSPKPKRFDNTEEYQAIYHEHLLKCFEKHPYLWATHVWNMFDFGSDGRDQGGDPGKNHKGLVTFDRKIKKDSFYLYKAYWSHEPFLHLCSTRYINRHEKRTEIKVYSTLKEVTLYHDEKKVATLQGDKIFRFKLDLHEGANQIKVVSGDYHEEMTIQKVAEKDPAYIVTSGNSMSWEKKKK